MTQDVEISDGSPPGRDPELLVEAALAGFASGLDWAHVPHTVADFVEDVLLDALANGIVGSLAERSDAVASVLASVEGPGTSGVLGSGRQLSLLGAVGQNAFQITAYTMCDVYRAALCHVTPEVVPAVLGVAKGAAASGADLLAAVTAGLEVTTRLGRGLGYPAFRRRGFHAPGMVGAIGAAAAASRAARLDPDLTREAMALAGAHAAGTFAGLGSDAIKVHQMNGARSAVLAVGMASAGLRGAARVITASDGGLLCAYSDGGTSSLIVTALGAEWELLNLSLRPRPGSSSVQSIGECTLELVPRLGPNPLERLRSAQVLVPPSAHAMCAATTWTDQLSALQSAPFLVAGLLAGREWWVELFDAKTRQERALADGAERVEVVADASVPLGGAVVELQVDETSATASRSCAHGDPGNPMRRHHVEEKLRRACSSAPSPCDAEAVIGAVRGLGRARSAAGLFGALGLESP